MENQAVGSTSTGMAPNVAGALAYVLGPITGVLFLVLEKENRFVRFHAAQAVTTGVLIIGLSIALGLLSALLAFIPVLGWLAAIALNFVLGLGSLVLWLLLMWRAYRGEQWEVPVAGPLARRIAPDAFA
ncbi:MAG: DUF4870 domain-containing protein [Gemmatimonadaceae bacterium]